MAQPQRNNPNQPRPQRAANAPADLELPKIAEEYGIDKAVWLALRNFYPASQDASIVMVYEYCKARGLDPLKKPVHIVPMWVKDANGIGHMRDIVMPGIQEMRITAARTREYAGSDPAKMGATINVPVTNASDAPSNVMMLSVPESVTMTVYRLVQGKKYAFTHTEYFLEAVARKNGGLINEMWQKRPIGQLTKCAEAGALRKAFPEELGGEYAAEEMEGREELIPQGLPSLPAEHGPSGVAGPETITATVVEEPVGTTELRQPEEQAKNAEASKAVREINEPQPDPRPVDNDEAVAADADDATDPGTAPSTTDFTIELPDGARGVLTRTMQSKGVTEVQLLSKLGANVTIANINQALQLVKAWE